jgi:hypothetical protein
MVFAGVTLKAEQVIDLSAETARIELSPYNRQYFKPGFPYRGMVSLLQFCFTFSLHTLLRCIANHGVVSATSNCYNFFF